eukprot:4353737-Pleurochrysis_carterae.AAC.1
MMMIRYEEERAVRRASLCRDSSTDNPYRPWGRKISDPTYHPSSVAQNGLRSHLNSSRRVGFSAPMFSLSSHSVFGDHTEWTVGVRGDTPLTAGAAIARSAEALDEDRAN